jgi:hypothetical protein
MCSNCGAYGSDLEKSPHCPAPSGIVTPGDEGLVSLIQHKRSQFDSEFDGEVPFTTAEAETLFAGILALSRALARPSLEPSDVMLVAAGAAATEAGLEWKTYGQIEAVIRAALQQGQG